MHENTTVMLKEYSKAAIREVDKRSHLWQEAGVPEDLQTHTERPQCGFEPRARGPQSSSAHQWNQSQVQKKTDI